jgi:hypothetical protein
VDLACKSPEGFGTVAVEYGIDNEKDLEAFRVEMINVKKKIDFIGFETSKMILNTPQDVFHYAPIR